MVEGLRQHRLWRGPPLYPRRESLCKLEAHPPSAAIATTWTAGTPATPRSYLPGARQGGIRRSAPRRWPGGALDLPGMGTARGWIWHEPAWPGDTISRARLLICCTAREVHSTRYGGQRPVEGLAWILGHSVHLDIAAGLRWRPLHSRQSFVDQPGVKLSQS